MKKIAHFSLLSVLLFGILGVGSYAEVSSGFTREKQMQEAHMARLYEEAEEAMLMGKWDKALRTLQLLNIKYPNNPYLESAKLSIIVCYQQKKEYMSALIAVNDFIEKHRRSEWLKSAKQLKKEIESQRTLSLFSDLNRSSDSGWSFTEKVLVVWCVLYTGVRIATRSPPRY